VDTLPALLDALRDNAIRTRQKRLAARKRSVPRVDTSCTVTGAAGPQPRLPAATPSSTLLNGDGPGSTAGADATR
jgi:hypothetical protein